MTSNAAATMRTHVRWVIALVVVATGAQVAYALAIAARQSPITAWDAVGADSLIVGPILASCAAWLLNRDHVELGELMGAAPRRFARSISVIVASLLAVAWAVHVLGVLIVGAAVAGTERGLRPLELFLPLAAVGIDAGYVGIGLACAALIRRGWSPLVAAAVTLGFPFVSVRLGEKLLWSTGGASGLGGHDLMTPRLEVIAAQVLLGCGLLALGVGLARRLSRANGPLTFSLLVAGLLLALAPAGYLTTTFNSRFWADDTPISVNCVEGEPIVCLHDAPESVTHQVQTLAAGVNAERARLQLSGQSISRVREVSLGEYTRHMDQATGAERWITADAGGWATFEDPMTAAESLVIPTSCRTISGWPVALDTPGTMLLRDWVLSRALRQKLPEDPFSAPLLNASAADREAWLKAAWTAVESCHTPPPLA